MPDLFPIQIHKKHLVTPTLSLFLNILSAQNIHPRVQAKSFMYIIQNRFGKLGLILSHVLKVMQINKDTYIKCWMSSYSIFGGVRNDDKTVMFYVML